ncbi:NUDIX hydrolase [Kaistella jeonii]|uniref:NUDIX hydrolase n=1 Tax=Kaistella jeonii TaxID=266749 RepID=A0A0C1FBA7_9FLAO|nr:NUDIX hydrolase [Kaistella jeonii]KIA90407.1 NUDIX hydrolase [Kaistella jeonii]SFB73352.1 NUDIX domain-containing protein [Kaistella jeonii]VEI95039.1 NADH pyrophosphatase [Kaistella jeonii]
MIDKINVRVYATVLKDKKILSLHEEYVGDHLLKFPGGGLEFGESILECLHREFEEELNLKIKNLQHFYTQEDFLVSKFRDNEQLLTIYYLAEIVDEDDLIIRDSCIEKIEWISLDTEENPFPLPIDKIVFVLLKKKFL